MPSQVIIPQVGEVYEEVNGLIRLATNEMWKARYTADESERKNATTEKYFTRLLLVNLVIVFVIVLKFGV